MKITLFKSRKLRTFRAFWRIRRVLQQSSNWSDDEGITLKKSNFRNVPIENCDLDTSKHFDRKVKDDIVT